VFLVIIIIIIIIIIITTLFSEGDIQTYKVKVQNMPYLQMAFKTELTNLKLNKINMHFIFKQTIIYQLTLAHMYS